MNDKAFEMWVGEWRCTQLSKMMNSFNYEIVVKWRNIAMNNVMDEWLSEWLKEWMNA